MPNQELLRIVDGIARDKNIEREQIYTDIEQSIASGFRKHFATEDSAEFQVKLDRQNGEISATRNGAPLDLKIVGRIGAQTVKPTAPSTRRSSRCNSSSLGSTRRS